MSLINSHDVIVATAQTLYTVTLSGCISVVIGLIWGCALDAGQTANSIFARLAYLFFNALVNVGRSIPFIILLIALLPITRYLVGTSIGMQAALVPLIAAASPFYARIVQSALSELPASLRTMATTLGLGKWQRLLLVYVPEARVSLIQGATLTFVGLTGYSAMAGTVGGGGLGQLAIDYGYQRFDVAVILLTVVLLYVLVQLLQSMGDLWARKRHWRRACYALPIWFVFNVVAGQVALWQGQSPDVIRLGVMSGVSTDILKQLQKVAQKDFHVKYKLISFDDYSLPNRALSDGSLDANLFQHIPFLEADMKSHGYHLAAITKTFVYPLGFYSHKIKNLTDLAEGDIVGIANDPTNEARALQLLARAHVITLSSSTNGLADVHNIVNNPWHLKFVTMAAAQLPRAMKDATIVALNDDFLTDLHLSPKQALLLEKSDVPYANVLVVRDKEKNQPRWRHLISFLHSAAFIKATYKYFPNGEAIKAWNSTAGESR